MMRRLAWLVFISSAVYTSIANAVGLGELTLKSSLNQPLNAEIKLLNVGDLSKNELLPNLASHQDFARAGVERVFFLTGIKFDVQFKADGAAVVNLKTNKIVREPFLNFLVELHWPSGRILREYTVLLDPPMFSEAPAAPIHQATAASPRPAASVPTAPEVRQPTRANTGASAPAPTSRGQDKVVIKKNDTLWAIARDNRAESSLSIRQTMMAIQRHNPHAFINDNINLIKAGQVLRIPSAGEVRAVSSAEALAETRRQNQEWREKRTIASVSEKDEDYSAAASAIDGHEDGGGHLKLVGDDLTEQNDELASSASGAAAEGEGEVGDGAGYGLTSGQTTASGPADATVSSAKVAELESQVDDLKRLLTLKDQQLALLQASAAGPEVAAVPTASGENQSGAETESSSKPAAENNNTSTASSSNLLDLITDNPIYIGVAILLVLVLLVILGAFARRRNDDEEYPMGLKSAIEQTESDVVLPDDLSDEFDDDTSKVDDLVEPEVTEAAILEQPEEVEEESEADAVRKIIEEAEIYTAYGRYERAMEIVEPALSDYPENAQLRLKMAEICIATDDAPGLAQQESKLQSIGDTAAIQQLQGLKHSAQEAADALVESDEEADTDILDGAEALTQEADELPDNVVEFDAASDSISNAEEADLDSSLESTAEITALNDSEPSAEAEGDEDFLGDTDESATKLELARAYIDMTDKEAAEDILNEVIEEGSDEQKQEARQLLESLG